MFPPDRLEDPSRPAKIDGVAFVEIRFRLAGNDRGEQEDHVGSGCDEFRRDVGGRDVKRLPDHCKRRVKRLGGYKIDKPRLVDRASRETRRPRQSPGQLSSDHASRADDERFHLQILPFVPDACARPGDCSAIPSTLRT